MAADSVAAAQEMVAPKVAALVVAGTEAERQEEAPVGVAVLLVAPQVMEGQAQVGGVDTPGAVRRAMVAGNAVEGWEVWMGKSAAVAPTAEVGLVGWEAT